MALTKVSRGLLSTGIVDNSNATALTLNSDESATFAGDVGIGNAGTFNGTGTRKVQIETAASSALGPELLIHNAGQGSGAQAALTFGGKRSGNEGYTASIHTTNNDGLHFGTAAATDFSALPTTRMVIDVSGNVGIGRLPSERLDVDGVIQINRTGDHPAIRFMESGTTRAYMGAADWAVNGGATADFGISSGGSGSLLFGTDAGAERMRVSPSAPQVAIGKTSFGTDGQGLVLVGNPSTPQMYFNKSFSSTINGILFYHANTYVGGLNYSDSATSLATSSDERLKSSIQDADDAGSKIDAIKVRKFDWKIDGSHQDYGFVAQELEPVFAHAVHTAQDDFKTKGVDLASLVPMLVKEIQSLRTRVAQLEQN